MGSNFQPDLQPELPPARMLRLGVFCGNYMTDTRDEFPEAWFAHAKLAPDRRDCSLNGGQRAGFILMTRAAGSNGIADTIWAAASRRRPEADQPQCGGTCGRSNDTALGCRRRQRQTLLHWAYDSRRI
jgi:hypothetical protein